ncbi:MAG TPA: ATP-binding protein [Methylomirabilota bacterium]|jgi:signal transduction histidine kinase|nr:ATP-binding protein [Methylomirabilota bacterium]
MRSQRPSGLRRAADSIFALISLLPLMLFVFFMWHFGRLSETMAQVGVLLALVIALLGFVIFRQMVDRISDRIFDLNRVVEGKQVAPAPEGSSVVPGLGHIAEIGDIAQAFSGMLRELRASTERLEDLVFKLGTLNDMVEMAARIPKIEDLLAHVLDRTMRAVSATIGSIMLLDRERQVLRVAVGRGMADQDHTRQHVEVKVGEGIAGRVVEMGEAVLVEDIEKDPRFAKINDPKYGGGSFICMPLRVGDRIVGVVNLAKKEAAAGVGAQSFAQTDLQFLNALMTYTAYAVDNARLFEEARAAAQRLEEVVEDQKLRLTLAQQQMLQAAKLSALGELVAGVAHELNNPLTVLIGTADMIEAEAPEAVRRHVHLMREAINSAQYVVRGLLTFGRRMPLQKTRVDLAELTERVLGLTFGELHVAEVKVRKEIPPDLPSVWADANQLQQVLVNLINNAKQAMAEVPSGERRLQIALRRGAPGRVRIQVQDSGPGIPADVVAKIFDPFVTTKSEGTGLGLSISYGIVREHGGSLTVESTPGQGATFVIDLPVEAPPAEPASNGHKTLTSLEAPAS